MRAVDTASEPVSRFVTRLLDSPALRPLSALQKEEQALNVLRTSASQLTPVFTSLGLDVSRGWREPAAQVSRAIRTFADRMLQSEIDEALDSRLELSFWPGIAGGRAANARVKDELRSLIGRVARHPIARSALSGSLAVCRADIIAKYISQAFERKKYLYVELTRVQRLPIPPQQIADLLVFVVLVRPATYLAMAPGAVVERDAGYLPVQEQYLAKILPGLAAQLPSIPSAVLSLGLRSTLAHEPGGRPLEATSRLGAILSWRGRALVPAQTVDRGADSPDKSWFSVQRKNARWHGLDGDMLDELYTIAAENRW
jgi:hypothetical protein